MKHHRKFTKIALHACAYVLLLPLLGCSGGPNSAADRATVKSIVANKKTIFDAASEGDVQALNYFVDDGANLNALDASGESALHYAALNGKTDAAKMLVVAGADPMLRDANGRIPFEVAEDSGQLETAAALAQQYLALNGDSTTSSSAQSPATVVAVPDSDDAPNPRSKAGRALRGQ